MKNPMFGLSNIFLDNYLQQQCKDFLGVFPSDKIPNFNKKKKLCCAVINLAKSTRPGSHFVALYLSSDKNLYYFDSFGLPPPIWNKPLIKILQPFAQKKKFKIVLKKPIQSFKSLFCGWFTAGFCIAVMNKKWTPKRFTNIFNKKNLLKNEYIVTEFLKE